MELIGYSTSDSVGINATRYRGDSSETETLASGDSLFKIAAYGFNGTSVPSTAKANIKIKTAEAWTTTANGTKIVFETTPIGSTTAAEVLSVNSNGYLGLYSRTSAQIKVTTPTAVGQLVFDSTLKTVVIGTATTNCTSWVNSTGTVPSGY